MKIPLSQKLVLMPRSLSWWVWAITAACLAAGLMGYSSGFYVAILISLIQTVVYDLKQTSALSFPVQIRFAYTILLILCQVPPLRWLYWVPTVGTFALVLFGYCLMARILSLLPGNRTEPMSLDLILRTFLTPPDAYVLEGQIASLSARTKGCKNRSTTKI
jgi:hypothetical protein